MKCFISLINKPIECLKVNCTAWDSDHQTCCFIMYLQGYVNQQRITVEMLRITRKLESNIDEGE
jgi:hypothetical protein